MHVAPVFKKEQTPPLPLPRAAGGSRCPGWLALLPQARPLVPHWGAAVAPSGRAAPADRPLPAAAASPGWRAKERCICRLVFDAFPRWKRDGPAAERCPSGLGSGAGRGSEPGGGSAGGRVPPGVSGHVASLHRVPGRDTWLQTLLSSAVCPTGPRSAVAVPQHSQVPEPPGRAVRGWGRPGGPGLGWEGAAAGGRSRGRVGAEIPGTLETSGVAGNFWKLRCAYV